MPWQHTPIRNERGCNFLAEGMTQTEVAEALGLVQCRVAQVERNGLRAIWRMQVSETFRRQRRGQMR